MAFRPKCCKVCATMFEFCFDIWIICEHQAGTQHGLDNSNLSRNIPFNMNYTIVDTDIFMLLCNWWKTTNIEYTKWLGLSRFLCWHICKLMKISLYDHEMHVFVQTNCVARLLHLWFVPCKTIWIYGTHVYLKRDETAQTVLSIVSTRLVCGRWRILEVEAE